MTTNTRTDADQTLAKATSPYAIRHVGWPQPEKVVLPEGAADDDPAIVTNRSLKREGKRWIPISGEIHFSRLPRRQWPLAVALLKAGGINLVSTYLFWNHHQPSPEVAPDFTDNRDIAAFLRLCAEEDLDVIVRIGPWAHGEARNGGFPDWVQHSGTMTRTNDPAYLALVKPYFADLAAQIVPFCDTGGPIIAVQVENELYDQPDHIARLKQMAQEAGIHAPIWTATGWGNAQLPLPEVFPVFSGYSEGFWVDAEEEWDDSFRSHFYFSDVWDDPGVGKDIAGDTWTGMVGRKHPDLPPATCELGSGMAAAYHCRPVPSALDVTALANVKLGSGSVWQGYYMYVGGTNPDGPEGLQESQASGYPNDLPRFNYDFHAPIGRGLETRESYHRYRLQHAFLEAFGAELAAMPTSLPAPPASDRPLRWSLRSDGTAGFVFVNNHQAVEPLPPVDEVQFAIQLNDDRVLFPPEPVQIPSSAVLALPVNLTVGGVNLRWATVNLIAVLAADEPVLVVHAHPGLAPRLAVPAGYGVRGGEQTNVGDEVVVTLVPGTETIELESADGHRIHVLVLDPAQALQAWLPTVDGQRRLTLSTADLVERDGGVVALTETMTSIRSFDAATRSWTEQTLSGIAPIGVPLELVRSLPPGHPTPRTAGGRAGVPSRDEIEAFSAHYRLRLPTIPVDVERAVLAIELVGDVADVTLAGEAQPFDDLFWDGEPWTIDLSPYAGAGSLELDVRVTAFNPEASIRLAPAADRAGRRDPVAVIHTAELRLTRSTTVA